jgi:predicted double-glycine peptidase
MLRVLLEGLISGINYLTESKRDVVLNVRPHVQLDSYSCGAHSLASVLSYYGYETDEEEVAEAVNLTTDGCDENDIRRAIRAYGLRHRTMRRMSLRDIQRCIDKDQPIIVAPKDAHWSVVHGYGEKSIYVMDPAPTRALLRSSRRSLPQFLGSWNRWGIAVYE